MISFISCTYKKFNNGGGVVTWWTGGGGQVVYLIEMIKLPFNRNDY